MQASIVITTYNRWKILQRALKSAMNQSGFVLGKDYEIVIVDHGSTDGTWQTLNWIDDGQEGVHRTWIEKNSGIVSTARNVGAKVAKGKYIVFLDDDNELMPDFLSETVPLLDKSPDMYAVSTGRIVKHSGYEDYAPPYRSDHRGHEKFISFDWGWLIRKEVFDKIQYDEQMFFHEDADFGLQFTERFAYMSLDKPLQIAYAYEKGESHSSPNPRMIASMDYFLKKNWRFYEDQSNELRYLYRLMGRRCYMYGLRLKGIAYFWKSFMALKNFRTFKHFFFILLGWQVYNWYMTKEEQK